MHSTLLCLVAVGRIGQGGVAVGRAEVSAPAIAMAAGQGDGRCGVGEIPAFQRCMRLFRCDASADEGLRMTHFRVVLVGVMRTGDTLDVV